MARYGKGRHAFVIDDRTGRKIRYRDSKKEWNGLRVHKSEWEPKHPQLTPPRNLVDSQNLYDPRPDNDEDLTTVNYEDNWAHFGPNPVQVLLGGGFSLTTEETPTGEAATASLGSPAFTLTEEVSGQESTLSLGTPVFTVSPELSSNLLTTSLGSVTLNITSNINATGQALTSTLSEEVVVCTELAVGQVATTSVGTVTISRPGYGMGTFGSEPWGQ